MSELGTPLSQACLEGDLGTVAQLLNSGVNYLDVDASGRTALHWAIVGRHLDIIRNLLAHHEERDPSPTTPPLHTLTFDKIKKLTALRARQPTITPIEMAAQGNDEATFDVLLESIKPFVDSSTPFNNIWRPLCLKLVLARSYTYLFNKSPGWLDVDWTKQSIREGKDHDVWLEELKGAVLHLAIGDGKFEVAEMLLRRGASPAVESPFRPGSHGTATHTAVWPCPQPRRFIQLLAKHGTDLSLPGASQEYGEIEETPLSLAVRFRSEEAVTALLEYGASPNAGDRDFGTPLIKACSNWCPEQDPTQPLRIVQTLLKHGADAHAIYRWGGTALHTAAARWNTPHVVKELLSWGADVNCMDVHGRSVWSCMMTEGFHPSWDWNRYHQAFDTLLAAFGTVSQVERAVREEGFVPGDVVIGRLFELGANQDEAPDANTLNGVMSEAVRQLDVNLVAACMESLQWVAEDFVIPGWDDMDWSEPLFNGLLDAPENRRVNALEHFLSILRLLDQSGAVNTDEVIAARQQVIQRYEETYGLEIIVEACLDLDVKHREGIPIEYILENRIDDMLSLSALYGRDNVVSLLIRRFDTSPTTHPSSHIENHWFKRDAFAAARSSSESDTEAVLFCLRDSGLLDNAKLNHTQRPLDCAIQRGDVTTVRRLLALDISVEQTGEHGWRPLHHAILGRHEAIVNLLLDAGADWSAPLTGLRGVQVDDEDMRSEWSPLSLAELVGSRPIVERLLKNGADARSHVLVTGSFHRQSTLDGFGLEPLGPTRLAVMQLLVDNGATAPDRRHQLESGGWTPEEIESTFTNFESLWDALWLPAKPFEIAAS
ncbi:ankyrin repeat-containing domain protein [Coprinopsis sp. MPI-PUGE-AT-0042]|nr:ankyrin repeat-containing domain protein [Coprinopsis sp. MPI-PUGE-AT-0042]